MNMMEKRIANTRWWEKDKITKDERDGQDGGEEYDKMQPYCQLLMLMI